MNDQGGMQEVKSKIAWTSLETSPGLSHGYVVMRV